MASANAKGSKISVASTAPSPSDNGTAGPCKVKKVETTDQLHELIENTSHKPLLIEFFAEWCGPCKIIALKLEEWATIYEVTIVKIDVDELEDVAIEYNVAGIPTFVLIKDKHNVHQIEGSGEDRIIEALNNYCETIDDRNKRVTHLISSKEAIVNRNLPITENIRDGTSKQLNRKRRSEK